MEFQPRSVEGVVSARFDIETTSLERVLVLGRKLRGDERGYLERMYCMNELEAFLGPRRVVQINHTLTTSRGTVRGMHFQRAPHMETKIVSCLRGEVFDVAVDLRAGSKTFLRWHGEVLSATNHRSLLIPEGFAHGFQTLTDDCEMLYFHTAAFDPDSEGGIHPAEPRLSIRWPEPIGSLSPRDSTHPPLNDDFRGLSP